MGKGTRGQERGEAARGHVGTGAWGGKETVQRCKCGFATCKGAKVGDKTSGGGWECRQAGEVSKGSYDFAHGYFPGLPA